MRKRAVGIIMASTLALAAIGTPVAADKTGDEIIPIGVVGEVVDCGAGQFLERDRHGWLDPKKSGFRYHIRIVYSNTAGDTWLYMDTGIAKQTDSGFSLSGRSTNVGPDDTGSIGHVLVDDGVPTRAGRGMGDVDQAACNALRS